ncbi:hypothetical protein ACLB1G_25960 [Oxalobacteraceae bacterium A2-2]
MKKLIAILPPLMMWTGASSARQVEQLAQPEPLESREAIPANWADKDGKLDLNARAEGERRAAREEVRSEESKEYTRRHEIDTYRLTTNDRFTRQFASAKIPSCLHADGLKFQPTNIGPIGVWGIYALPFIPIAYLRGKCN